MPYYLESMAVCQRILKELWYRKRNLIFWAIFPISILLLNTYIIAQRSKLSLPKAMEFVAPSTLVGVALFFSCLGGTVATIVSERENKTLKRLFLSPLRGVSYFLGIFFAHCLIGIGQTLIVYTIASFYQGKINGSILLGIAIIFLSIMGYVGVGFILGTQLARRTEDVNALVATFGVPLLILGGSFLPSFLFPKSLLKIARFNPIYHMNEALIQVWTRGKDLIAIQEHFIFLCIFAILMIFTGWFSYQNMLQKERRL
jgi:ABC-2 type transport system permease protein